MASQFLEVHPDLAEPQSKSYFEDKSSLFYDAKERLQQMNKLVHDSKINQKHKRWPIWGLTSFIDWSKKFGFFSLKMPIKLNIYQF